jgi:hypothetical protein
MIYKTIKKDSALHSNAHGKTGNVKQITGVGIFERKDSQTYTLLCTIDKNIDDPEVEAERIASLLNENRKYFTAKEAELKGLRLF